MRVTFDPAKKARDIADRGLPFERWPISYGKPRFCTKTGGRITARHGYWRGSDSRLHVAVITMRGDAVHAISFRKSDRKEVEWYEQEKG